MHHDADELVVDARDVQVQWWGWGRGLIEPATITDDDDLPGSHDPD
jgi:hypothetical protein